MEIDQVELAFMRDSADSSPCRKCGSEHGKPVVAVELPTLVIYVCAPCWDRAWDGFEARRAEVAKLRAQGVDEKMIERIMKTRDEQGL